MVRKKKTPASLVCRTSLRVRFSEVDSMQIVWHGEYARYFEDGREAFGQQFAGLGYMDIYHSGYVAPLVKLQIEYKQPLRCGDRAVVETRYINSDAAKIIFEYTLFREEDMQVVATGESVQVFLNGENELELVNPQFYVDWKERWITA